MGRAAALFRRPAAVAPLPSRGGGKARNPDRGTGQFICSITGHIHLLTTQLESVSLTSPLELSTLRDR